jgi:hypothetical protein
MSMFERATRLNLRFDSPMGPLMIEDLWSLPLTSVTRKANLDDIAKAQFALLKSDANVSFVEPTRKSNDIDQLKFDIVKHIIDVRLAENALAAAAKANREKKQLILGIIAQKENETLLGASMDDLRKMADAL